MAGRRKMEQHTRKLRDGRALVLREADSADARALLDYIEAVSGESNFLTFGPGEFELTEEQEADLLRRDSGAGGRLYLVALIDEEIVAVHGVAKGEGVTQAEDAEGIGRLGPVRHGVVPQAESVDGDLGRVLAPGAAHGEARDLRPAQIRIEAVQGRLGPEAHQAQATLQDQPHEEQADRDGEKDVERAHGDA